MREICGAKKEKTMEIYNIEIIRTCYKGSESVQGVTVEATTEEEALQNVPKELLKRGTSANVTVRIANE